MILRTNNRIYPRLRGFPRYSNGDLTLSPILKCSSEPPTKKLSLHLVGFFLKKIWNCQIFYVYLQSKIKTNLRKQDNNMNNNTYMSNTTYKHRNCIIQLTPTEKYPDMVTITTTPKLRQDFEGRRYLTLKHAHKAIELYESERLINSKQKYVKSYLKDVIIIPTEEIG